MSLTYYFFKDKLLEKIIFELDTGIVKSNKDIMKKQSDPRIKV
jgi:hypothetical protein